MRLLALACGFAAACAEVRPEGDTIPDWGFRPPPASRRHLRRSAEDPEHASRKVYPPPPTSDEPKSFDTYQLFFQELYEKQRDGVMDNEEVWRALLERDLAILPDILGHDQELQDSIRGGQFSPDERASMYAAHDIAPLWPSNLYDEREGL